MRPSEEAEKTVEVLEGPAALGLLSNQDFVAQWRALHASCPWATVGQLPDFVRIAYEVYGETEPPVLVVGRTPGGAVWGVLALAQRDGILVHAAESDCEYHQCLALPGDGDHFMTSAIRRLRERFGPIAIHLAYLTPEAPVHWTSGGSEIAALCELGPASRRIVRTRDPDKVREYLLGKNRLRKTLEKLRRSADVRLRRVVDPAEIARMIDHLAPMFELRKGSAFGVLPFRDQPLRRKFLMAQAEVPGLLHLVVLERDGRVLAAHLAATDQRTLALAGIMYDPFEAHHSPALLMLLELIELLCREGYALLDLTPGDQEYKARMGEELQETLHTLVVHGTRAAREARRLRDWLKPRVKRAIARLPAAPRAALHSLVATFAGKAKARSPAEGTPGPSPGAETDYAAKILARPFLTPITGPGETIAGAEPALNDLSALSLFGGSRDAYLYLLRSVAAFARARGEMYTVVKEETLAAVWFLAPAAAVTPPPTDATFVLCGVDGPFETVDLSARPAMIRALVAALPSDRRDRLSIATTSAVTGRQLAAAISPARQETPRNQ